MKENTKKTLALSCCIFFVALFTFWGIIRIYKSVSFNLECKSYLKIASDANSYELASKNLNKAVNYLEKNNLTTGISSIFFKNPQNDVGFWYTNLKTSLKDLKKLEGASSLEKSNCLLKLRETLTDVDSSGTAVTYPDGISIFPYNIFFFLWGTLSFIGIIISSMILIYYNE